MLSISKKVTSITFTLLYIFQREIKVHDWLLHSDCALLHKLCLLSPIVCEKHLLKKENLNLRTRGGKRSRKANSVSASSLFQRGRTHAYFGPSPLAAVKHLVSVFMLE